MTKKVAKRLGFLAIGAGPIEATITPPSPTVTPPSP
jgi:hypothetical protein